MGTRSYVAAETERGTIGVYVHWDGYPEGRLPVLRAIAARDGLAKMVKTIVGKPNGWSSLSPNAHDADSAHMTDSMQRDGRFELVPGYGVEYTEVEGQADTSYWTPATHHPESWAEYIYIIRPDGSVRWAETEYGNADVESFNWHVEALS